MNSHNLDDCTCETRRILVNATLQDNLSNVSSEIWCSYYNDCCGDHLDMLAYWLGGVIRVIFCIIGIILNIGACCVWGSTKMRHPFNLLLIALCIFDCGFLMGSVLASFRNGFKLVSITMLPAAHNRRQKEYNF